MRGKRLAAIFAAVCCAFILSGCHVFAWYIPKAYSADEMARIYAYINEQILTDYPPFIAGVTFASGEEGTTVNVWKAGDEIICNFEKYPDVYRGVIYRNEIKTWDIARGEETVSAFSMDELEPVFDAIDRFTAYLKTLVGGDYDDGYCHMCAPWGFGMAQIYYGEIGDGVSASWTVEKKKHWDSKPLIFDASFSYSSDGGYINLELYPEGFDIAERIENILRIYEEGKTAANGVD